MLVKVLNLSGVEVLLDGNYKLDHQGVAELSQFMKGVTLYLFIALKVRYDAHINSFK